jgi:tryptophan synthase alpha chain
MNPRTAAVFETARQEGRAALIGYLPAGFPTVSASIELIQAMFDGGVDLVEVGLPYSDPLMDGPAIQEAVETALAAGVTTSDVMRVVSEVAPGENQAVVVMSYWNPIERYGQSRFAQDLHAAGGSGVITPDLIPEEAGEWIEATNHAGIDRTFLVAPSSTDARIDRVASACTGFVYAASTMGVTGARDQVSSAAPELVSARSTLHGRPDRGWLGSLQRAAGRRYRRLRRWRDRRLGVRPADSRRTGYRLGQGCCPRFRR